MKIIEKKIWPEMFDRDKNINIDIRLADFNLEPGDKIRFREWNPKTQQYTGREYTKIVKQVTKHSSPTKYYEQEELEKYGIYIIELG